MLLVCIWFLVKPCLLDKRFDDDIIRQFASKNYGKYDKIQGLYGNLNQYDLEIETVSSEPHPLWGKPTQTRAQKHLRERIISGEFKAFKNEIGSRRSENVHWDEFDFNEKHPNCFKKALNQGSCSSCWAFGETACANDRLCAMYDQRDQGTDITDLYFAPQEIISTCCVTCGDCNGGGEEVGTHYYVNYGGPDEDCHTYTAVNSACPYECTKSGTHLNWERDRYYLKNNRITTSLNEVHHELKENGGVTATFAVFTDFQYYYFDVYTYDGVSTLRGYHDVNIHGWGVQSGGAQDGYPYWYIKNSWGANWGDENPRGFFKMLRGVNECGIEEKFRIVLGDIRCPFYCYKQCSTKSWVCNGHGTCASHNNCECDEGFSGERCTSWKCNSIVNTDNSGCNNQGKCVDYNVCECNSGRAGTFCELTDNNSTEFSCFGYDKDSRLVCSGHGECLFRDKCNCSEGYDGDNCEDFFCFSISKDNTNVCSKHGECLGADECSCDDGYYGSKCDGWNCYGIKKSGSVCSGHGICEKSDTCSCYSGYTGTWCQQGSVCGYPNDPDSCSGHGKCVDNFCECDENYSGATCNRWYCNEVEHKDTTNKKLCNGVGTCVAHEICECTEGFAGKYCEFNTSLEETTNITCGGIDSVNYNSPYLCSGHGRCIGEDTCDCDEGFSGFLCDYQCFGIDYSYYMVCGGLGKCVGVDTCKCVHGHYGEECEVTSCFGVFSSDPLVCSGHGECTQYQKCACNIGYFGERCEWASCNQLFTYDERSCSGEKEKCIDTDNCQEYWECFGVAFNDTNVCNGHGDCILENVCKCDPEDEYTGVMCNKSICFDIVGDLDEYVCSGNGYCYALDSCKCFDEEKWKGEECEKPICFGFTNDDTEVCSGNGNCTSPGNCKCNVGFKGSKCEFISCFDIIQNETNVCSGNGKCSGPNNCICNDGFILPECEYYGCNGVEYFDDFSCYGHGDCIGPNNCTCWNETLYPGEYCNNWNCYGISVQLSEVCSGHGECVDINDCSCFDNYFENDCNMFECFGILRNESACYGNGECVEYNVCECEKGYIVEMNCERWGCFNILPENETVCSSHGECKNPDSCECEDNYFSYNCGLFYCNNVSNLNKEVCSSHGNCVDHNICECEENYSFDYCSKWLCFGVSNQNENACSGNGICKEYNVCDCFENYYDVNCSLTTCFGTDSSNDSVCSGHGSCLIFDNCECFGGYGGEMCETNVYQIRVISSGIVVGVLVPVMIILFIVFVVIIFIFSFLNGKFWKVNKKETNIELNCNSSDDKTTENNLKKSSSNVSGEKNPELKK